MLLKLRVTDCIPELTGRLVLVLFSKLVKNSLFQCTKQEQWPCLRAFIDYCAKQSRNADPNEEVCRKGCPSYVLLQQLLQLVDEPSHTPLDKEIPHDIIASILTIRENIGPS